MNDIKTQARELRGCGAVREPRLYRYELSIPEWGDDYTTTTIAPSAAKAKADYARGYAEAESERGAFGKALLRLRARSLGPASPDVCRFLEGNIGSDAEATRLRDAHAAVERFNATVPAGTPVRFWPGVRDIDPERRGETRTLAQVTAAGVPVVWVTGYASSIALTHVEVMP